MKKICFFVFAAALLVSAESKGAVKPAKGYETDTFTIGVATWFSRGEGEWTLTFDEAFDPGVGPILGKSKLAWDDLDAPVVLLNAEYKITPMWRIGGTLGGGQIEDGKNTDTDWYEATALGEEFVFSESESDTEGDVMLYNIDVYLRLNELFDQKKMKSQWDLIVGYQYYEDDLSDKNGVQTMIDGESVNIPFEGLDDTYTFEWSAIRLGLRGEYPWNKQITLKGSAVYFAAVDYEGEGYWNLRDDFRAQSPNFTHEASNGYGGEIKLGASIALNKQWSFELGYWWFAWEAEDGTDTVFTSDGSTFDSELNKISSTRDGVYVALAAGF